MPSPREKFFRAVKADPVLFHVVTVLQENHILRVRRDGCSNARYFLLQNQSPVLQAQGE